MLSFKVWRQYFRTAVVNCTPGFGKTSLASIWNAKKLRQSTHTQDNQIFVNFWFFNFISKWNVHSCHDVVECTAKNFLTIPCLPFANDELAFYTGLNFFNWILIVSVFYYVWRRKQTVRELSKAFDNTINKCPFILSCSAVTLEFHGNWF